MSRFRFRGEHLQVWDDSPLEMWGQVWISVCKQCYQGPLNADEVVCGECVASGLAGPSTVDALPGDVHGWRCHRCPTYRAPYPSVTAARECAERHQRDHHEEGT